MNYQYICVIWVPSVGIIMTINTPDWFHSIASPLQALYRTISKSKTTRCSFTKVSWAPKICVLQKSYLLWEFEVVTLVVCPKPCFGYMCKVSAWNYHHKCDFWHCVFSGDYFWKARYALVKQPPDYSIPWWLLLLRWIQQKSTGQWG